MRKPALVSMSSFIAEQKAAIAERKGKLASINAHRAEFNAAYAVANQLAKAVALDGDYYVSAEPEVTLSWDGNPELSLRIYANMYGVESLKSGRVPRVLEAAERLGFEFHTTDDYASEYMAERTYRAKQTVGGVDIRLSLCATIKSDAEACRKVQIGTEIKEVAKYAIVCE